MTGGPLKTYIFNTNFNPKEEATNGLVTKQRNYMEKCNGDIAISSDKSNYNYNDLLQYNKPHMKSLCFGLYIEDHNGIIKVDKHFPKTKALFIATMWAKEDIYVVANNGFYSQGQSFTENAKNEDKNNLIDLYSLDRIYLIYIKGDVRNNVLLENFEVTYDKVSKFSIVSYGRLEPNNILKYVNGYSYAYSESIYDLELLNNVNHGYAIGDRFPLSELTENVEHVNKYYFINKYIELYM